MIAAATFRILQKISAPGSAFSRMAEFAGTYHLTASGETSWCGFARAILEECADPTGLGPWFATATGVKPLIAESVYSNTTPEYPTPARRPHFSVLSNDKLRKRFGFGLPDWRTQLRMAVWELAPEISAEASKELR